jgi:hypothetical protein
LRIVASTMSTNEQAICHPMPRRGSIISATIGQTT